MNKGNGRGGGVCGSVGGSRRGGEEREEIIKKKE